LNDNKLRIFEEMCTSMLEAISEIDRDHQKILEVVNSLKPAVELNSGQEYNDEDLQHIVTNLETIFSITMKEPHIFESDRYRPWLDNERANIQWFYWERYRKYLRKNRNFSPNIINQMEWTVDKILDHMENPTKPGDWDRKGMVVGNVQSGKTANYTGLITKAADAGYRIIVVFAGVLNSLRSQTQSRIDEGFIGTSSEHWDNFMTSDLPPIGAGIYDTTRKPTVLTNIIDDFKVEKVRSVGGIPLQNLIEREPVVFVVKKNASTIKNLHKWFETNRQTLEDHPLLVIDDEADQASINTNKSDDQPTAINRGIRKLLSLFSRSSYVGYTATPFANIFIEQEPDDPKLKHSLFPKDFIFNLDSPSNYQGPESFFGEDPQYGELTVTIKDNEKDLPIKHKKTFVPETLPKSLEDAVRSFIIVHAIRTIRGQNDENNSMLVNVSRFTDIQSKVKNLVFEYVLDLRAAVSNFSHSSLDSFLGNNHCRQIYETWNNHFSESHSSWHEVQNELHAVVSRISVIEVNSSKASEKLDYSQSRYPNGRSIIAIGGFSLSRGITLEGLTISYFLRNSMMYDTLMQMGRWFGYRGGYEDLCRLYMKDSAISWYTHITSALKELRDELDDMSSEGLTPEDYGLKVRSHPENLIVTARNKMRSGSTFELDIDLSGKQIETTVLRYERSVIANNQEALISLLGKMGTYNKKLESGSYIWRSVEASILESFFTAYENHEESLKTQSFAISRLYKTLEMKTSTRTDVILVGVRSDKERCRWNRIPELAHNLQKRGVIISDDTLEFNKRRVGSTGAIKMALDPAFAKKIEREYLEKNDKKNCPDNHFRRYLERPVLMLQLIDYLSDSNDEISNKLEGTDGILAWSLTFPSDNSSTDSAPSSRVKYVVNTVWWKNRFSYLIDNEYGEDYE